MTYAAETIELNAHQIDQLDHVDQVVLNNSIDAIYLIDRENMRFIDANETATRTLGYSHAELLQLGPQNLRLDTPDPALIHQHFDEIIQSDSKTGMIRTIHHRKDGSRLPVEVHLKALESKGRQIMLAFARDISAHIQTDALTGLPNRSLLSDRLAQLIALANRSAKSVAVMLIDLDRFKNINESLGHDIGDQIIIETGRRLASSIPDGDTVARLGGDEFIMALANVDEEDVTILAQQVLELVSQPMVIQGHEFYPTGSIGISLYPKDGTDCPTLLKNADTAMYRAKAAGRNNFQFYAQEMNARALHRLKLEGGLRRALERQEFVLHYQPQLDIVSGQIVGVEALLRWNPAGKRMLPPIDFISIAEESGLIVPIGEWVLRTACMQSKAWETQGLPPIKMAVNLSARQFQQQNIEEVVHQILEETACNPRSLELEITESVLMETPEATAETLQKLNTMGVQLSIDDFGTGYSSLSYLKRFPIHSLKIDQSFVKDIATDSDDAAITKAVIMLAHSMKLKVITEGVETMAQLDFLRQQDCDQVQGNYFSQPLPEKEMTELLRNKRSLW